MTPRRACLYSVVLLFLANLPMPSMAESVPLPNEVRAFIEKRNDCDHFRGEASPDAGRQAEIDRQVAALCTGSDAELARLMRRYAKDRAVLQALDIYDINIERLDPAK